MMENFPCRRWMTTNQDEYRNPVNVRIDRKIESNEFARYEDCMARKDCEEERLRDYARKTLCCTEQNQNREPVLHPTDSHVNHELKACKAPWCRCLATGDPRCFEEVKEESCTDDMCYCKQIYRQMDPTPDNTRQKVYSSTNFIDYRDPDYSYIKNKCNIKKVLDDKFWAYKKKVDAEDAAKEPKISPAREDPPDRLDPNCMGIYDALPPEKLKRDWKADERWWREDTSDCVKGLVKKYIWTSTYREMNKDGAALPLAVHALPSTCLESPPGDPVKAKAELSPVSLHPLGEVFEKWDRPQVRIMANRCDTMYNRPPLEYDTYFKFQRLCRTQYARNPEMHEVPSEENMRLAREDKLRMPFDRMIPGYMGYDIQEAPPVCKIKKSFDPADPYEVISTYQSDFTLHPKEAYEEPPSPYKPSEVEKSGISTNPLSSLTQLPLPCVSRLSCYLECNKKECPVPVQTCS